jgi:hypothetical protein
MGGVLLQDEGVMDAMGLVPAGADFNIMREACLILLAIPSIQLNGFQKRRMI